MSRTNHISSSNSIRIDKRTRVLLNLGNQAMTPSGNGKVPPDDPDKRQVGQSDSLNSIF